MQDTSPVFEKIKVLLDERGVAYRLFEHEPVFTSEEAARVRGFEMRSGAKAMMFSADGKPVLVVVPGDTKVDTHRFKAQYHIRDLRLLKPEEVLALTGLEIGCIPPFGNLMNLPTYMDARVLENKEIAFNPGSHTKSITMRPDDFVRLCSPAVGSFSKK